MGYAGITPGTPEGIPGVAGAPSVAPESCNWHLVDTFHRNNHTPSSLARVSEKRYTRVAVSLDATTLRVRSGLNIAVININH